MTKLHVAALIRPATVDDLPAILAIRGNAGAERLSNPLALTDGLARRLIAAGAVWVWQAPGEPVTGFVAIDAESGAIAALLVAPGQQGRGIGRALLAHACDALRDAGHAAATIALEPGTAAERHYRTAGWIEAGVSPGGELILQSQLQASSPGQIATDTALPYHGVRIEFDPDKDARNLALRGISLSTAAELLGGFVVEWVDARRNYGETRNIAIGEVAGREFFCVYTRRGEVIRVISLRRAKRRERNVYQKAKAEGGDGA